MEPIGFPVSAGMFELTRSDYRGTVVAKDLLNLEEETVRMGADFVCDKDVKSRNGQRMKFGTFLDSNGDFMDMVHFP